MTFIKKIIADVQESNLAGRIRISSQRSQSAYLQINQKDDVRFDEKDSGGGETSVYEGDGISSVNMTVAANNEYVVRQSKEWGYYYPGKPLKIELTASNFQNQTNVTKRLGYFSSSIVAPYSANLDGFFFESDGTDHYACLYRNGTEVFKVASGNWLNQDMLVNFNPANFNFYVIEFLYLGGAAVVFSVLTEFGLVEIYRYSHILVDNSTFVKSPNQPVRYEIRSSGGAGSFNHICSDIATEGDRNDEISISRAALTSSNPITTLSEDVRYAMLGIRLKPSLRNIVTDIYGVSVLTANADDVLVELFAGGTLAANDSGVGFVDDPDSSLQILNGFDVQAAGDVADLVHSGGIRLLAFLLTGNAEKEGILRNSRRLGSLIDGVTDEVYLCVTPITNGAQCVAAINWKEFI